MLLFSPDDHDGRKGKSKEINAGHHAGSTGSSFSSPSSFKRFSIATSLILLSLMVFLPTNQAKLHGDSLKKGDEQSILLQKMVSPFTIMPP